MVAALFFKAILCLTSLIFAMNLMGGAITPVFAVTSLIVYCFLGIPFCALFQQWSRMGNAARAGGRLGEMSEAERKAAGAPLSGAPGSQAVPPSMDMGMGGPPPSGHYGHGPGMGMPPPSGGYGIPQSG